MDTTDLPAVADLARRIDGPVLLPGDDGYDRERSGFNLAVEHRPAPVVVAASAADVAAAAGLAPLSGSSPLVGAVSYLLGGGLPVLGRTFGWAADRVRRLEVVTAGGDLVNVSPDSHADLFWALRGGKGGFGIVTAAEIELVALPRLYGGGLIFAADRAAAVAHAWREWSAGLPDAMNTALAFVRLPDLPVVPEPLRGRLTAHVRIAFAGSSDEGAALVRPLRALGPLVADTVAPMSPAGIAAVYNDPTEPIGYDERSLMLRSLDAAAVDALVEVAGPAAPGGVIMTDVRRLGGALARLPEHPRALDHHDAEFSLATVAMDPAAAAAVLDRLRPWSTGLPFLNFLGGPAVAALAGEAFPPATLARLAAIKRDRDPAGIFPAPHLTTCPA